MDEPFAHRRRYNHPAEPGGLGRVVLPAERLRAQGTQKHRLLVLSDIEADPDDTQSLIRLLLYANRIDIEGLVATTSVHQKTRVAPESMERVIRAYGKVQPNLNMHEPGFPAAERLLGLVKRGVAEYGMRGVGKDKDSEGSKILELLEKSDERPLWVSIWGGSNTLAQAQPIRGAPSDHIGPPCRVGLPSGQPSRSAARAMAERVA